MKLKISGIENVGDLEKERVVLRSTADQDVGGYVVFKTKKTGENRISPKVSDVHWFDDKLVKKDDWILLYTKTGTYSSTNNEKGNTSHFFYWNKTEPLWNENKSAAILLYVDEWKAFFPDAKK
jgi:hypothetical protein